MPTFLRGIPIHPLIVHAVVVLVPLAALGAVAIVVWPTARRRFGWLVVALAALATATVPLATSTGEGLEGHLRSNPLIERHAELGDQLLPLAVLMLVGVVGFQGAHHIWSKNTASSERLRRIATLALALATLVGAGASLAQVVRIGDAGAQAAWSRVHYIQRPADTDD